MISNSFQLFGHLTILLLLLVSIALVDSDQSLAKNNQRKDKLKNYIDSVFSKKEENFYDYSILCGRDVDAFARVDKRTSFIDRSIPNVYRDKVIRTYIEDAQRDNKCPRWSPNVDSSPKSGSMGNIKIQENVKPGETVYILSALSDKQLYYFMRNAEDETDMMFEVITESTTNGFIGRVILKEPLDYESKKMYKYIVYAFDGYNLIERLSSVEVIDVDDEPPTIDINHPDYNMVRKRFEFQIYEDASIDHVLNSDSPIRFADVDTQPSQLKINLVNSFTGSDVPFSLSVAGKLSLTGSIDFETQADYLLRITVKDGSNGQAEELIYIKLIDVPDLSPIFVLPSFNTSKFKHKPIEVKFYENQIGTVFEVKAMSRNKDPLGAIHYHIASVHPIEMREKFRLHKNTSSSTTTANDTFHLNCIEKIEHRLDNKEQQILIVVRATESADAEKLSIYQRQLTAEITVSVRVVSGDMCKPTFDKELYEFEVAENETPLLGGDDTLPILVEDCDYDTNGRIFLSTTNKNFHIVNDKAYRRATIGFELKRPLDYDNLEPNEIEFSIIARGASNSINRFESSTRVRIRVLSLNEFTPQFVLPEPKLGDKNNVFTYSVPENKDFHLRAKAIDSDRGADGQIVYGIDMLDGDRLIVKSEHNSENDNFDIVVPGEFLDASSRVPISFLVRAHDNGKPEKASQLVIIVKAYPNFYRPPYFEFQESRVVLSETSLGTFKHKLKILDDNLVRSNLELVELNDPLDLFSFELEDVLPDPKLVSNFHQFDDEQTEKILSLRLTNKSLDLDEFYALNGNSDTYVYTISVSIENNTKMSTQSKIYVTLEDVNDNAPVVLNLTGNYVEATLDSDFKPNTPISLKQEIRFDDADFDPQFGVTSLYLRVNDTRFIIDQEAVMNELNKFKAGQPGKGIPLVVKCLVSPDQLDLDQIIWLNVSCEDSIYSLSSENRVLSTFVLIRLSITKSLADLKLASMPVFEKKFYEYTIDENWSGKLDKIKIINNELSVRYDLLTDGERFELVNENDLMLKRPLDYDNGERVFNISIRAENVNDRAFSAVTYVLVIVNDLSDNAPSFIESEFKFAMARGHTIASQTRIGSLYAFDLDNNDELKFTLKSSDETLLEMFDLVPIEAQNSMSNSKFRVGSGLQGVNLIARTDLDLEKLNLKSDKLSLTALVADKAQHEQTAEILIKLVSSVDFKKKQQIEWTNLTNTSSYRAQVKENAENNTLVTEVRAVLVGATPEDQIRYQLLGEPNFYYRINETTGSIYTTGRKMSRKTSSALERQKSNVLIVQASYSRAKREKEEEEEEEEPLVWSIVIVQIELEDQNDTAPLFLQPPNNKTRIILTYEALKKGAVYQFKSIDPDMNDEITYKLVSQDQADSNLKPIEKKNINLPFRIHRENGSLDYDMTQLSSQDYLKILENIDDNQLVVRLQVESADKYAKASTCYLYVQFDFKTFYNLYKKSVSDLALIELRLQANSPYLKEIQTTTHAHALRSELETQKAYYFAMNHSVAPNTIIAQLKPYLNNTSLKLLPETLRIISESTKMDSSFKPVPIQPKQVVPGMQFPLEKFDPTAYFSYDPANGTIKLIRRINNELIKNISFYLTDPLSLTEWKRLSTEINSQKINVNIVVNTNASLTASRRIKKLGLDLESENLILIDVFNMRSVVPDGKQAAEMEAIKEQMTNSRASKFWSQERNELITNRIRLYDNLMSFYRENVLDSFRIRDGVNVNELSVKFGPTTDKQILDSYSLVHNETHVEFKRVNELNEANDPFRDLQNGQIYFKFSIELKCDNEEITYYGNLYIIDAKQIQRILHMKQEFTTNAAVLGKVHRSKIVQTRINLEPVIRVSNPLPIELKFDVLDREANEEKVEKGVSQAKYFTTSPSELESWLDTGLVETPKEIKLVLQRSLEDDEQTVDWKRINLKLRLSTSNAYINRLLETLDTPIDLTVGVDNLHLPLITEIQPVGMRITLREGKYDRKEIAHIRAFDKDVGDPGRLEYFLIGSSLLDIQRHTGTIFITGDLDAETEQEIKFYCYARDLAPEPLTKQSEIVEFIIKIVDVDEFKPVITPPMGPFTLKENEPPSLVESIVIDCFDRDVSSNVNLYLTSIRYVLAKDANVFIEDPNALEENRLVLRDLFRLVYFIDEESAFTPNQTKQASLKLTREIDYERLYRAHETLIRIDLVCADSASSTSRESRILIRVEDVNDNAPVFLTDAHAVVKIDEAAKFESILRVSAYDLDSSPAYGNDSLVYSIVKCEPDPFMFFIDKRTGDVYSQSIVDTENADFLNLRRELYAQNSSLSSSLIEIKCRFRVSDSQGKSFNTQNSSVLSQELNLTIQIENLNDNAPIIRMNTLPDSTIEVKEGESTRGAILTKIAVVDYDDPTGLKCLFDNRLSIWNSFELKTSLDESDPFFTWCVLKVRDDMFIDYDAVKMSSYLFELLVVDEEKTPVAPNTGVSRAQIRVRVIPVNSRPPMFASGYEQSVYTLDTFRPGTVIATILATDFENPNPDRIIYELDSTTMSHGNNKFELVYKNTTSLYWGSVNLVNREKLDVSESPYILSVTAYDGPIGMRDTLKSRKTIKVYVLNKGTVKVWVNRETGQPVDYYPVIINEELDPDTQVVRVQAVIPNIFKEDTNQNDVIYSLDTFNTSMTLNPYYQIDPQSGEITTTNVKLDYEEKDPLKRQLMRNIRVKASTQDGLFEYQTYVSVTLQDVNDNAPKFDYSIVSKMNQSLFCVVENRTSMQQVGVVHASDLDSGVNGRVEYRLDETAPNYEIIKELFEVDQTSGAIFLRDGSRIDREMNETIQMSLQAYDGGVDSRVTSVTVNICVLDVNDNKPEFAPGLIGQFTIEENSLAFGYRITASDADLGSNGTVFYYIDSNQEEEEDNSKKFYIEPLTGHVSLTAPLDYEEKKSYELVIVSSDNGRPEPLKNTFKLVVNVKDLNDNQPKFSANLIEKTILQSIKPDETIVKLDAVDLDASKEFHSTEYVIKSVWIRHTLAQYNEDKLIKIDNDLFELGSKSGVLRTTAEASLTEMFYLIQIEAFDQNRPELRDRLNISLKIKPTDDSKLKPVLTEKLKNTENKVILFKRNLRENLDALPESKQNYVVDIVRAEDPLKQGLNYYLRSIEEITPLNRTLPLDSVSPLFAIDLDSGVIKTTKPRSFYKADTTYKLNLRIASRINETLSSDGVLFVQIDSTNDSLFDSNVYIVQINENQLAGTRIFNLSEKRVGKKENIRYKLNKQNSLPTQVFERWFRLDEQSGVIETNSNEIDYEKFNEILLAIGVFDEDSDLIETITCKIEISDLNDNVPTFDLTFNYEPRVSEDSERTVQLERVLAKFSAFDLDGSEANSQLNLLIESIEPSSVYLNESSFRLEKLTQEESDEKIIYGLYKLAGVNLDRDNKQIGNSIRIKIKANDNGSPMLSARKEINLTLLDLNDNAPVITNAKKLETLSINEDQDASRPIIRIEAYDLDEGANAFISYDIQSESTQMANNFKMPTKFFRVDTNGNLYLQTSVDYERERWIDLVVILTSSSASGSSLMTRQNIRVHILNVNDNYPQFVNLPGGKCQFDIQEGAWTRGAVFYQFDAKDDDQTKEFTFEIAELSTMNKSAASLNQPIVLDSNLFRIDFKSGRLALSNKYELDREMIDNYRLVIRLRDQPVLGVQKETNLDCFIQVTDTNDNAPVFMLEQTDKNNTEIKVFPLMNEVSVINWFAATDADLGANATVEYTLHVLDHNSEEFENLFEIDSNGYLLMNAQLLTRKNSLDLNDVYTVQITASDRGVPQRLSSKLTIRIKIDENYFSLSQISVDKLELDAPVSLNLDENVAANTHVCKVNVVNSFVAPANKTNRLVDLRFSLLTANETFRIDERTGVITVRNATRLDYEHYKEFLLSVEASETVVSQTGTNKTRVGMTNIMIKVVNMNDNPAVFNMPAYEFSCEENQLRIPFEILNKFVQITDADLTESLPFNQLKEIKPKLNGPDANQFSLVLVPGTQFIYKLEALNTFDYERKSKYDLEINVWDGQFETISPLRVNILDLNDHAPKFEKKTYEFNINENSPVNTFIGKLKAFDQDGSVKMNTVNYKILNVNIQPGERIKESEQLRIALVNSNDDLFSLNRVTGELAVGGNPKTARLLDRETILSFNLTVIAYNPADVVFNANGNYGEMTDVSYVIVRLNDLNDMAPEFEDIYVVDIREKSQTPRALLKLNAVDLDAGLNGKINYSIESINGRLYSNQEANNEFYIEQTDADYYLYLNLYADVDSKKTSKSFEIVIVASDSGAPTPKSSRTTARVNLIDINDNKPKISEPQTDQIFEFEENNKKDMFLFQVRAFDPDYSNNKIEYSLDKDLNQDWQYFKIDRESGKLKTLISFDYETKREYSLRISCTDLNGVFIDPINTIELTNIISNDSLNAYPLRLTSFVDVRIRVIDADDNEPEFLHETFMRNVSEILEVGATVAVIPPAREKDTLPQNVQIRYLILAGNEEKKFSLNETSGEIELVDELERSLIKRYELKVRATSKKLNLEDLVREDEANLNAKSNLLVVLDIVKDKLFIQFEQNNYYISVQQKEDTSLLEDTKTLKQFVLDSDLNKPILNPQPVEELKRLQSASIFFSRSHLVQRKLKRKIRFSLDMLKLIRYNEDITIKLPSDLICTHDPASSSVLNYARNIVLSPNRSTLFDIDSQSGKIYMNRELISKLDYEIGDQFVLTIVAAAYAANSTTQMNQFENAMTQLTVRLTERDYSFMMSIRNSLNNILLNYLNPLKEKYIPRLFDADGVKLAIQDLTPSKLSDQFNSTGRVDASIYLTQPDLYDLVMQVGTSSNLNKQIDLDLFMSMLKNFSTANVFEKDFNKFTQRQPVEEEPLKIDLNSNGSFYDFTKPFYMNWLFWVLLVVGLMVFMILGFFINCAYMTKHHKLNKNSGLVIEYPSGYAPLYRNGFLSLANRNDVSEASDAREYEDQELAMNLEEEEVESDNETPTTTTTTSTTN